MTKEVSDIGGLTFEQLADAVAGDVAAVRTVLKLQPAGGEGDKVFPPTYQGGAYAREKRRVGDTVVDTVLLDSVQSQANRMEQALKKARERGDLRFPLITTDFSQWFPEIGRITTLDAPHRIADAIFRDSLLNGQGFRDSSPGKKFIAASALKATALLELCPTALVFGVWDSTGLGPRAGLGAKFQRALVSEVVGFEVEVGVRTASRIDPLPISAQVDVYEAADGDGWTIDPENARQEKGKPVPFRARERARGGRPSSINLGNVTPDVVRDQRGNILPGGVSIRYAKQTAILSLPALRRLSFPLEGRQQTADTASAARTLLAALALAAVAYQREEGFDLRSRCLLVPVEPPAFELIPGDGSSPVRFSLEAKDAQRIFNRAVERVRAVGLPWSEEELVLTPSERLRDLVQRSLEVGIPLNGGDATEREEE